MDFQAFRIPDVMKTLPKTFSFTENVFQETADVKYSPIAVLTDWA
jgi:hypothetical protein